MRLSSPKQRLLLLPLVAFSSTIAHGWTLTQYYQHSFYSGCTRTLTDPDAYCATYTERATLTGTEIPTGTAFTTTTNYNSDTVVQVLVPTDAPVALSTFDYDAYSSRIYTYYLVKTTIQPSASCSRTYSNLKPLTTDVTAYVPPEAEIQVTPTSTSTSAGTGISAYTYIYKYIPPISDALPSSTRSYPCYYFSATSTSARSRATSGSSSSSSSGSSILDAETRRADNALMGGIIFLLVWFLFWFIGGIFEAVLNFRQIMVGDCHFKGGVPFCWLAMLGLIPGLIYAFYRGKLRPARGKQEQDVLLAAWDQLTPGQRAKLLFKHGFSSRTPAPVLATVGSPVSPSGIEYAPGTKPEMQQYPTPAPSYHPAPAPSSLEVSPLQRPVSPVSHSELPTNSSNSPPMPAPSPQGIHEAPSSAGRPPTQTYYPPPPGPPPPPQQQHGNDPSRFEPLD